MSLIFIYTLISGIFVAAASGLIGSFLVLRRMTLMSDALSHVALPGIALGVVLHFEPILGGILALLVGIILIWLIETKTKLATESVTGVLFATALAIGSLLIPEQDLLETFFGSVQHITIPEIAIQTVIAIAVIVIVFALKKRLTLFSIAPDLSASLQLSPTVTQLLLLTLIALTIAIGISFVGVLLISALSIIPAATARNLAKSFNGFVTVSIIIAVISLLGGLLAGNAYAINPGIMTVLISAACFVLSLFKKK